MKQLSVLVLCVFYFLCQSQTVWNKTYIADRSTMLFGSVLAMNSGYIVSGVTTSAINSSSKTLLGHIDLNGNLTDYKAILDSTSDANSVFTNALIKTSDGRIAFTGQSAYSHIYLFFGIADTNFNSVSVFNYTTPNSYLYYGHSLLQNGNNYYVAGIRSDSLGYDADVFLMKIDSAGNRLWEKYYNQAIRDQAASIIKLQNGHFLLGCEKNDLNQTHQRAHTWLLEVDTNGLMVRQWFDPNDSMYAAKGLRQTQDGGFIYGARKKFLQIGATIGYTNTIVKMDSAFNKQWTFNSGTRTTYTGIEDIEELADGSFIACGQDGIYGVDTALWGYIVKLDVFGNKIWDKYYRAMNVSQTFSFLSDIDVMPDGSLTAVGQYQRRGHTPPQTGWFLKLDANGCEMDSCLVGVNFINPEEITPPKMQLLPNPSKNIVQIVIENKRLEDEIKLYDVTGRIALQKKIDSEKIFLDVSQLPKGMYVVVYDNGIIQAREKLIVD